MYRSILLVLVFCATAQAQLTNPDFEIVEPIGSGGLPAKLNDWDGNTAMVVGAEQGIVPFSGSGMLRFLYAHDGRPSGGVGVGVRQFVEAKPGQVASASAVFNRVLGDAQTDTEFHLEVEAYGGTPGNPSRLDLGSFTLLSDGNPLSWEPATASLTLPQGTTFVGVHLLALENIFNDTDGEEFDGHYADAVTLTVVPEPASLVLLIAGLLCCWLTAGTRRAI